MRFELIVKKGPEVLARIEGRVDHVPNEEWKDIEKKGWTVMLGESIIQLEHQLERIFGLRFHIEQIHEKGEKA